MVFRSCTITGAKHVVWLLIYATKTREIFEGDILFNVSDFMITLTTICLVFSYSYSFFGCGHPNSIHTTQLFSSSSGSSLLQCYATPAPGSSRSEWGRGWEQHIGQQTRGKAEERIEGEKPKQDPRQLRIFEASLQCIPNVWWGKIDECYREVSRFFPSRIRSIRYFA